MNHPIRFPNLNLAGSRAILAQIAQLPSAREYVLDFERMEWVEPLPMLLVASAIQRAMSERPESVFRAHGFSTKTYATYMGFFRELGIDGGPASGSISPTESYIPITSQSLAEISLEAEQTKTRVGRVIERISGNIARTLVGENHGKLWETVQYALREIIRNAAEHSQSEHVFYCGQYWPERGRTEIAILDEGIGIGTSLRRNPHVSASSDLDALRLSVFPGISGTAFKGAEIDHSDEWANSGFGLYVVSELCRRGGDFTVISGDAGLQITSDARRATAGGHGGTALRLTIDTNNLRSIAASLELIVSKGERIAEKLLALNNVEASAASKIALVS